MKELYWVARWFAVIAFAPKPAVNAIDAQDRRVRVIVIQQGIWRAAAALVSSSRTSMAV